jgi:hypothetical protein
MTFSRFAVRPPSLPARQNRLQKNIFADVSETASVERLHGSRQLAMSVKHVLDLPPKIGGNIVAGLLKPQLDHPSRVLSILRRCGWINGKRGQCLERIECVPPRLAI